MSKKHVRQDIQNWYENEKATNSDSKLLKKQNDRTNGRKNTACG